ncbi:MAG: S-adenosyl-L-methionine-dependent methyltransferase [Podila humilis]|nr:MAG: S-adenosyl-L-methionine-dependent methyltransferase [Podila humilis]
MPLPLNNQAQTFVSPVTFLTDKDVLASSANLVPETLPQAVCHGRVQNPEVMVQKAWWKSVFGDNLYLQTDGDVVEDPAITLEEVRLLENYQVIHSTLKTIPGNDSEKTRILDLCCGQGRHILQLAKLYPHLELHGHDQSEYLIRLAQSRAEAAEVTERTHFTIGDCRSIPHPDNTFSLVLVMGNSFGYFATDNANTDLLKEICRILKPGGIAVLDLADGAYLRENFSPRGWEWIDDTMIVCRERQLSKDKRRLVSREVVISTGKGVIRDQFYQECLYDLNEIDQLVREAGLVTHGKGKEGDEAKVSENTLGKDMSKRGEDLGMMEQRNFVLITKQ